MATHKKRNPDHPSLLPEDIMYSILLWLPVKSLLRCKSVCKSWLSLISSLDFIKTHLSISTNDPQFTRHHLLLGRRVDDDDELGDYWTCSVYSLLNEDVPKAIKLARKGIIVESIEFIVGYCHGLVCLKSCDNDIILWNPSTREARKLPKTLDIFFEDRPYPNYGFGYDEFNDDYKVFAICGYKVSVYSSKSNCWRMIRDYPFEEGLVQRAWGMSLANGVAIHWVFGPPNYHATADTLPSKVCIVSLDVKTETYRKLLLPKPGELTLKVSVCCFGKSLAVLYQLQNKDAVDIWVIEDSAGVEERWKKLFTIPYTNLPTEVSFLEPVCIYETHGIMLKSDNKRILLYNSRDKTIKYPLQLSSFEYPDGFPVQTYVESLVSPHVQN